MTNRGWVLFIALGLTVDLTKTGRRERDIRGAGALSESKNRK